MGGLFLYVQLVQAGYIFVTCRQTHLISKKKKSIHSKHVCVFFPLYYIMPLYVTISQFYFVSILVFIFPLGRDQARAQRPGEIWVLLD